MKSSNLRAALLWFTTFAVYLALAKFGLEFSTVQKQVSPIWPASGFAVAIVSVLGLPYATAIFCGVFLANWWVPSPAPVAFMIAIGNTLECLVGAVILRRTLKPLELGVFNETGSYLAAALASS